MNTRWGWPCSRFRRTTACTWITICPLSACWCHCLGFQLSSTRYIKMKSIKFTRSYLSQPEILIVFVYLVCFTAGFLSLAAEVDTLRLLDQLPDFCIFKRLTGYKCPGCGMTHAFLCLGRFQFSEALRYNIFSVFLFYGGFLRMIYPTCCQFKLNNRVVFAMSVMVIAYWIGRNMDLIS